MGNDSNPLLIVLVLVAVLAAGAGAGAVVVAGLGGGSSTTKTIKTVTSDANGGNSAADQGPVRRVHKTIVVEGTASGAGTTTIPVTYVPYSPSDPSYSYVASLPSGGGWSAPVESHPTGGDLLRTSVRGPDGTLVIIDRTPSEVPTLGGGYDSVKAVSHPYFGSATEYLFSESEAIPECNGSPCVDFLIEDGGGGGWGVLAGGPSLASAQSIGSQVAQSISYGE
jgi:hypothetical protein